MSPVIAEWTSFMLRWLHVIAGIAWIGSSFYFVHLDLSLRKREGLSPGIGGEAWQVHGGGFYRMQKYLVAPPELPADLTWFKWEAYTTWISGFLLLVAVYYANAGLYLIDATVLELSAGEAIGISLALLAGGWLAYDLLCRSPIGRSDAALLLLGFAFLIGLAWACTLVFSGRGAFLQIGAITGTIMVANVFMVIIPNQKKVVASLMAGEEPDPRLGVQAKQRSLHNNYLTLPVLFLMISGHYPLSFATRWNWIIVAVVIVIGVAVRHFFNMRHAGRPTPWWTWGVAAAGILVIVWLSTFPGKAGDLAAAGPAITNGDFVAVEDIIASRCSMCHAVEPVWEGIASAPRGVRLDTPGAIRRHADQIETQVVLSRAMPPGNVTMMTEGERDVLAVWLARQRGGSTQTGLW